VKYDDASWHYGGNFPAGLPPEAGGTHAGMFVAWAILRGLGGILHLEVCPDDARTLRERRTTPGKFLFEACDEKFTDEDLNDEGNAFAKVYYQPEDALYLKDYEDVLAQQLPSLYHVSDSWVTYDALTPALDARLAQWRSGQLGANLPSRLVAKKRPWWRFW
jgi:hypothetical protein